MPRRKNSLSLEQKIDAATCRSEAMLAVLQEQKRLRRMVLDLARVKARRGVDLTGIDELLAMIDGITAPGSSTEQAS